METVSTQDASKLSSESPLLRASRQKYDAVGAGCPGSSTSSSANPTKLAAVALANKMARIASKLMVTGNSYAAKSTPAALMGAA
jgi:hypothetical protein